MASAEWKALDSDLKREIVERAMKLREDAAQQPSPAAAVAPAAAAKGPKEAKGKPKSKNDSNSESKSKAKGAVVSAAASAAATGEGGAVSEAAGYTLQTANNVSGYRGVTPNGSKWSASLRIDGKQLYLGTYATPVDAAVAYAKACNERSVDTSP